MAYGCRADALSRMVIAPLWRNSFRRFCQQERNSHPFQFDRESCALSRMPQFQRRPALTAELFAPASRGAGEMRFRQHRDREGFP